MLHLTLPNQVLDCSRDVFDRDVRVDAMLIIEIDDVGPESFQRTIDALLDPLGATVLHLLPAAVNSDPELRGDHHLPAQWSQRLTDEFLVRVGSVNFGGIEECDAAFHGRANERDHRLLVRWETVALAHPHAAEPEGRDLEIALSKFALLHWSFLQGFTMTLRRARARRERARWTARGRRRSAPGDRPRAARRGRWHRRRR